MNVLHDGAVDECILMDKTIAVMGYGAHVVA